MKELIKEAESLYWQIDKVVWNLIATRENKDDEGKKKNYLKYGDCNVWHATNLEVHH